MTDTTLDATAFGFESPELQFGDNVVDSLQGHLRTRNIDYPLFVTDEGIEEAGILDRTVGTLDEEPHIYYATTEPGTDDFTDLPTGDIDGVVGLGGGSCLDSAKVAAILLAHNGHPADYLGVDRVPGPVTPLIAVPTTSGTGSQSTQTAVLTHQGVKRGISDEALRPDLAVVDPTLTFDLPPEITARAGFDAFMHALESLTARSYQWVPNRPIKYQGVNPLSRPLSRRALRLVHGGLEAAVFDSGNQDARRRLSLGAHLAGLAFSNAGLGIIHALASSIGGMTGKPHGACLGASLFTGLTYNRPVRSPEYAGIARSLGFTDATSDHVAADRFVEECDRLRASIGLPGSLADIGLDRGDIPALVDKTVAQERRIATNPRAVSEDLTEVIDATFTRSGASAA